MITKKDIERMAMLAKLEITEEEIPFYIDEMQNMLEFAEGIKEDLTKEKTAEPQAVDFSLLRSDDVEPSVPADDILSNAKDTEDNYFLLRKKA